MMRRLAAALALTLAACSGGEQEMTDAAVEVEAYSAQSSADAGTTENATTAEAPPPVQARATPPPPGPPARGQAAPGQPNTPPAGAPLLAYGYSYSVEAPTEGVRALLRSHERACQAAGPLICQVIGATSAQRGERDLSAQLQFRAVPAYAARFRDGLDRDVRGARGEVTSSEVETEDLTRSIIDTEARLRAGRLLRTRLEGLIASRPGNLEQLLEIERELARVQGELDAAESTLAVMRARVAMSTVTVDYASRGAVADPGDGRPLAQAVDGFARNLAGSLAAILTFISVVLPWAVLLGLAGWGLWWLARRNERAAKAKRPRSEPPAPAPPADFGGPNRLSGG